MNNNANITIPQMIVFSFLIIASCNFLGIPTGINIIDNLSIIIFLLFGFTFFIFVAALFIPDEFHLKSMHSMKQVEEFKTKYMLVIGTIVTNFVFSFMIACLFKLLS